MLSVFYKFAKFFHYKAKYYRHVSFSYSSVIGKNSSFEGMNKLCPHSFFKGEMGVGTYIGPRSYISGQVGRYTSIGPDVKIIKGTHPYTYPFVTTCPMFFSIQKQNGYTYTNKQLFSEEIFQDKNKKYNAIIGSDCWIGDRALIVGGLSIGDGAMVLAGAVVTKDVPPYAIVGGVPAKVINYRYKESDVDFLMRFQWWNKSKDWLSENVSLMGDIKALIDKYSDIN